MRGAVEQTKEIYLGRNLVDIEKVKQISGVFFYTRKNIQKHTRVTHTAGNSQHLRSRFLTRPRLQAEEDQPDSVLRLLGEV